MPLPYTSLYGKIVGAARLHSNAALKLAVKAPKGGDEMLGNAEVTGDALLRTLVCTV